MTDGPGVDRQPLTSRRPHGHESESSSTAALGPSPTLSLSESLSLSRVRVCPNLSDPVAVAGEAVAWPALAVMAAGLSESSCLSLPVIRPGIAGPPGPHRGGSGESCDSGPLCRIHGFNGPRLLLRDPEQSRSESDSESESAAVQVVTYLLLGTRHGETHGTLARALSAAGLGLRRAKIKGEGGLRGRRTRSQWPGERAAAPGRTQAGPHPGRP